MALSIAVITALGVALYYVLTAAKREADREIVVLTLLVLLGSAGGLDLVNASKGKLARGTIYVRLERMRELGLVDSHDGDHGPEFHATWKGERHLAALTSDEHVRGLKRVRVGVLVDNATARLRREDAERDRRDRSER